MFIKIIKKIIRKVTKNKFKLSKREIITPRRSVTIIIEKNSFLVNILFLEFYFL